ncbi:MAG: sigma 54-interacting transcriptional regulator [Thermoanaerobaculales bacterium]|nr:sigma 54-interacting transcriptional regulator [Thermoanaerobaculales bacterium]
MPFRLVGTVDGEELSLLVREGTSLLGASATCDLWIDHPTVSRRHARLTVTGTKVEVVDEGSHNGTYLNGCRIERVEVEPGAKLAFGKVRMVLEEISDLDVILGLEFGRVDGGSRSGTANEQPSTVGFRSMVSVPLELMPVLLSRLEKGQSEFEIAQAVAVALFENLPATRVEVRSPATRALLFEAYRDAEKDHSVTTLTAHGPSTELRVEVLGTRLADTIEPLFAAIASGLRLAGRSDIFSPDTKEEAEKPLRPDPPTIVAAVRRIYDEAERVAQGDVGVLIGGESGTGKEVLARFLHNASPRRDQAFVTLNCAALPNDLLESELFGIEQGVATGVDERPGKFEAAHGGTLFLDEIADMSLETQAKILRVLQEGEVYRLGASVPRPARCRIIAASNRDLTPMRAEGTFREDLYYRIAVWVVEIPALRHRPDDIPNLAAHFLQRAAHRRGIHVRGITEGALIALKGYHWPGNIRQLENEMARAALFLGDGDALDSHRLSSEIVLPRDRDPRGALEERLEHLEKFEILAAFQRCGGNASNVARELGIGRSTLYRRMKALGIDPGSWT